ncbi:hypothetical protein B0H63DRAFT_497141 [Podospora didyma]|uniref:GLEYA adhesin domain-containing protein n=1 Tax=Podospora didyma TaxID=330526 RepID=A0AAE0K4N2_9PEZI|nr:hypothetical protein B0H63DRAFT_497141 [Podospora didyma]
MKHTLALLPGFAWLAAAACCRSNLCLREITGDDVPGKDGLGDCSSYLAVTVTPEVLTIYETATQAPVDYTTQIQSDILTVTETTVASTETRTVTVKTSSTATTEVNVVTAVETVIGATETLTSTITSTKLTNAGLKVRQAEAPFPEYATSACKSFNKYASACSCAGVLPTTVTLSTPSTTITVTETNAPVQSTVLTTASATETTTLSLTETITDITTEVDLLTATIASTTTATVSLTTTTAATATKLAGICLKGAALGAFKANATQYGTAPLNIYANLLNGLTGGITWSAASASTAASVQNKYIWSLDENARLNLAYNVPPYTYKYYAYMSTASPGSNWPQVNTEASVAAQVNNGGAVTYITGCVDSVTGELTLNAAGRTHILWCGQQLWMSYAKGEDINRGVCVEMFPRVGRV